MSTLTPRQQSVLDELARRFLSSQDTSPFAIAQSLKLPPLEVLLALDELVRLKLVAKTPKPSS